MNIGWSEDLLLLDGSAAALPQIQQVDGGRAAWVLIRWARPGHGRPLVYVLSRDEFFRRLKQTPVPYRPGTRATLQEVFALNGLAPSILVESGDRPTGTRMMVSPELGRREAPGQAMFLTGLRFADLRGPAVGGPDVGLHAAMAPPASRPAAPPIRERRDAPPVMRGGPPVTRGGPPRSAPPPPPPPPPPAPAMMDMMDSAPAASAAPPDAPDTADDEGTQPQRFPSIEPEGALQSGQPVTLVVDLLRAPSATTVGAVAGFDLPADWSAFEVTVTLLSPDIEFDAGGRAAITVRRNAASVAARVQGRLRDGLPPGHAVQVLASFHHGTRMCGSAMRVLAIDGAAPALAAVAATPAATSGTVQVDLRATPPDLTVQIKMVDGDRPGRLFWLMDSIAFAGRPAKMDGVIDLGQKPEAEASALFTRFAKLVRGQHQRTIDGFGEELWRKSPPEFQALYWALWDHLKRPFTIQFITNDPHMPWELMRPLRQGERHKPLALTHAVARWLMDYKGEMGKNRLPAGKLVAVAPHYPPPRELPLAEAAAQALVDQMKDHGQRLPGTYDAMTQLLESPPAEPVAVLYFNGHGAFTNDAAGTSLLKLENGAELTPMEVKRDEVVLGERHGTVVFLNACEVGASGTVLGNVGGWADAFLSRKFRAFIAPLWAIDEEDGAQVTAELMDAIVTRHQPMGEALRDLRAKHGAVSPTFYSYLLYGDVTARMGAG
jgi:hypothetical protein